MTSTPAFPFSAVVGHDDAKLALVLAALDPRLSGVLLRGQKGSAKTTLARGLAALLPGDAPFVELPLGATEDRVLGSIDLASLLAGGEPRFRPGLLAAAHGGVLYVDEINLLADHLVDSLLDVAASGVNRVERDGISHEHPARFVLVGSMNPEEGELRPQLLDRFGLSVDIVSSTDVSERVEAVRRRLAYEADPATVDAHREEDDETRRRIADATPASLPPSLMELASNVALAVEAEGLRADLMLCRAAAALAGYEQRGDATEDDLRRVAPFVLGHRRRRAPFDEPGITDDELDDAFDRAAEPPPPTDGESDAGADDSDVAPDDASRAPSFVSRASTPTEGRRSPASGARGRFIRAAPAAGDEIASVAVTATATAVASRRASDPNAAVSVHDLREAEHEHRAGNLIVFVVDSSGSMGASERMAAAKGAVLGLLSDAYQRRDRVALVAFRGEGAEVLLRPTGSIEVARARLTELPTGGATPLAAGLEAARRLANGDTGGHDLDPILVVITDGRATGAPDAVTLAQQEAERIRAAGVPTIVIDAETGTPRLGLAAELARVLDAVHLSLDQLDTDHLQTTIRHHVLNR